MRQILLELSDVRRHFGGVKAVDGVGFCVEKGSICGLIGPNGAGKTTLVDVLTGATRADDGSARFGGEELLGRAAHQVAALGVARTFQTARLYRDLTVTQNVIAGAHLHRRGDVVRRAVLPGRARAEARERAGAAARVLARCGLDARAVGDRPAGTLAYGDQRRVELARALAAEPLLLVLDEPAAGLNAGERQRLVELLRSLHADGITILLIEHDMRLVTSLCDHLVVLDFGRKIADGPPAAVTADEHVIRAYLGTTTSGGRQRRSPIAMGATTATTADTRTPALLEVNDLHVKYGAIRAVRGASFSVAEGELAVLIGANGAGKSTILNTLSGVLRPHAGAATFDGLDLTRAPSAAIVRHGLVQVPEGREILARLTVRENLELASRARTGDDVAAMFERFPALAERADVAAGQLSGGEQQQLAIARALVARPRLLLLDEPSLGLAPQTAERVFREIEQIHAQGITVLLVEQNAAWALDLADRAFVLETGRIGLAGTGQELRDHPDVRRAYLGS